MLSVQHETKEQQKQKRQQRAAQRSNMMAADADAVDGEAADGDGNATDDPIVIPSHFGMCTMVVPFAGFLYLEA